ncbi:hypothetical protein [Halococcus sp. IIIV-5B]|uniref:hypothetical protein n=1 Tax=Halococcus sp. IIIV-5B TaxID=2321230 RepID=UPI000E76AFA0|nr:hypothetical protein [Halococcus sp. IIIV-5B]RJT07510.1 hypothetical protein D3261_02620 [Halococcus sp. IIIV-5B]
MSWERRLSPLAQDALDILSEAAQDNQEGEDADNEYDFSEADFTTEEAQAALVADEAFTEADATYALDVLYRRGHIYYVNEEVYITPTDD